MATVYQICSKSQLSLCSRVAGGRLITGYVEPNCVELVCLPNSLVVWVNKFGRRVIASDLSTLHFFQLSLVGNELLHIGWLANA